MSRKKGFKLTYGVFSYTCSNLSSARSLYKQQRLIVVCAFNQKEYRINLIRYSQTTIRTE